MRLPLAFSENMRALLGEEEYRMLENALQQEPVTSFRVNGEKNFIPQPTFPVELERVPWCATGFYASDRPTFTFDPLFHAGCYYVQEASSMFLEQVLRQYVSSPVVMLDLCAAPGGKSTHAVSVLPEGSLLVSNEVMRSRYPILVENLSKWGQGNVAVTNLDPSRFASLENFFDVILTDVPCSGEGMFRKDSVAVAEWSEENVSLCWQRQRRILTDIWPSLKPGGILIYSTCTYNPHEDEENVRWMVDEWGAEPLSITVNEDWHITPSLTGDHFPVYHFLPHRTRGEGFFLAAVRKPEDAHSVSPRLKTKNNKKKVKAPIVPEACKQWLRQADSYEWVCEGDEVRAYPKVQLDAIRLLQQQVPVGTAGISVAALKGKDCIPTQILALRADFHKEAFPCCELTYEQAIAYLRKEVLVLPSDMPRGYVVVTYRDYPLGFVKNIGNRANNLYPSEWRIRSGYIPEERKCL